MSLWVRRPPAAHGEPANFPRHGRKSHPGRRLFGEAPVSHSGARIAQSSFSSNMTAWARPNPAGAGRELWTGSRSASVRLRRSNWASVPQADCLTPDAALLHIPRNPGEFVIARALMRLLCPCAEHLAHPASSGRIWPDSEEGLRRLEPLIERAPPMAGDRTTPRKGRYRATAFDMGNVTRTHAPPCGRFS